MAHVCAAGRAVCGCPARGDCYHLPHIERTHRLRQLLLRDPLGYVRECVARIARLAEGELSFETLDQIGRAADRALDALDECEANERRAA